MNGPSPATTRWAAESGVDAETLLPQVYDELRRLAVYKLRNSPPGHTLQATALVHEAYLKIAQRQPKDWNGRTIFLAAAARVMRDVIVDSYRARMAQKRGGGMQRVGASQIAVESKEDDHLDLIALDAALKLLEQQDKRMSELVLQRYFAGVSIEQVAENLGISVATANREWRLAKAWLRNEIGGSG